MDNNSIIGSNFDCCSLLSIKVLSSPEHGLAEEAILRLILIINLICSLMGTAGGKRRVFFALQAALEQDSWDIMGLKRGRTKQRLV